ncbi:MAG: TolC family protein [Chitinispirillales bacterium]|jgi:outer membrane protein TolC|nr:TolC family protein [Chitinispirillales bacterium]
MKLEIKSVSSFQFPVSSFLRKSKQLSVVIILCVGVVSGAFGNSAGSGKDTLKLSLKDALQRAMRDNPLIRVERINTDIASAVLSENKYSIYEPHLRAQYGMSDNERNGIPFSESGEASLSLFGSLPTGTNYELGIGASALSQTSRLSAATPAGSTHQNSFGITVTQSLLQGLSPSANLAPLRKASIDVNIREEELAAYAQRLLGDTERAYWDLLLSGEQMKIYEYSLELAQRLLYESEERLKIGNVAPIDLVAIKAEVASRERQLFDAVTAYQQKMLYLVYLMNAPELWNASLALTESSSETLGSADSVDEHLEAARKFRPDLRLASMQAQKGELDLAQTKNGLLPKLDFFISLQGTSYAESFSSALTPDQPSSVVSAGLTLNWPLTNGAARERHRRAVFSTEQQKLSIENFSRLLEYEIRSAHMEVVRAHRQIKTAEEVSMLQLQKLEAEQDKMAAGKSTGYAVLQIQRDLVSANLDEAQARTTYINALLSLYSRDGTLLARRGVSAMQ